MLKISNTSYITFVLIIIILFCTFFYKYESYDTEGELGNSGYNVVVQTISDNQRIPQKVQDNWNTFAPGIKRIIMTDTLCIEFFRMEYDESYVRKFNYLKRGAHKADLFRYAWLFKNGGVYMDIKTELIKPFIELFPNKDICYMVTTDVSYETKRPPPRIYNGIIATPPGNPMMFDLLKGAMQMTNDKPYRYIVEHGYDVLNYYVEGDIQEGLNETRENSPNVCVYVEVSTPNQVCSNKLDRYNLCMFVVQGTVPIIKVRHHDYPW